MKPIAVYLNDEEMASAQALAKRKCMSKGALGRLALKEFIERNTPKPKKGVKNED